MRLCSPAQRIISGGGIKSKGSPPQGSSAESLNHGFIPTPTIATMKLLATALFLPSALAANLIWGSYPSNPQCSNCLDLTFEVCEGDYTTPEYARCMCAGEGSTSMVSCMGVCSAVDQDSLGISWVDNVASGWYTYCVMFDEFKSLCAEAQEYVSPDLWAEPVRCGNVDAVSEGDDRINTTGVLNPPGPTSTPTTPTDEGKDASPTPTKGPSKSETTTGAGAAGRPTSSSAAANPANPLPTLGVIVGLGIQLMGMNM
ncbi:hypothetical protein V8F20_012575 [Naviculisporaceae sp. PSN 640]